MNSKQIRNLSIFISLVVFVVFFSACKSTNKTASIAKVEHNADSTKLLKTSCVSSLDIFLSDFENATIAHRSADVLKFMNKEYKEEQLKKLLKNNTDSFLNKFFSDNQTKVNGFKIEFKNITKITRISTGMTSGYVTVDYKVEAGSDFIILTLTIFTVFENGVVRYSIYGPVG